MKIVIVQWIDVFKMMSDDAFNDYRSIDSYLVSERTIGWLFQENKNTLMIVQEFLADGMKPRDYIVIPKCLIRKITLVSDAK